MRRWLGSLGIIGLVFLAASFLVPRPATAVSGARVYLPFVSYQLPSAIKWTVVTTLPFKNENFGQFAADFSAQRAYATSFSSNYVSIAVVNLSDGSVPVTLTNIAYPQLAVDPNLHHLYAIVTNSSNPYGAIAVIDDRSGQWLKTLPVGLTCGLAANPATHQIYQGSYGFATDANTHILQVNGASYGYGPEITIPNPDTCSDLATNTTTNRLYVTGSDPFPSTYNLRTGHLEVIDGGSSRIIATLTFESTWAFNSPMTVAVDTTTNRVYVVDATYVNGESNGVEMTTIDGATNQVLNRSPLTFGGLSYGTNVLAVDSVRHRVFVGMQSGIEVHDGVSGDLFAEIPLDASPYGLAYDPATGRLYAATSEGITVIQLGERA